MPPSATAMNSHRIVYRYGNSGKTADCIAASISCATSTAAAPRPPDRRRSLDQGGAAPRVKHSVETELGPRAAACLNLALGSRMLGSSADVLVLGQAFGMITQYVEDPTVRGSAAAALVDHALQFGAQRLEPGDPLLDLAELPARDGIGLVAGGVRMVAEVEEFEDRVERKTQLPRVPNER
jgi:hypothetical protein